MAVSPAPTNVRVQISEAELRSLYLGDRLTIEQVAARFGVAATTISRRMRDLGIAARPRGPLPGGWTGARTGSHASNVITWSAELAWVVGLITTDGNLSPNGRGLSVTSMDQDLLETVQRCLGLDHGIGRTFGGWGHECLRLQWKDRTFYRWLTTIGLMPAKSLRLGPLAVPDEYFRDFLRGCIDGDGSIAVYVDRYNTTKHPKYVYDRLFVSLVSASPRFIEWVRANVLRLRGLSGYLSVKRATGRHDVWCLKYAKRESVNLLKWIYYAPDVPALARKRQKAARALATARWYRHDISGIM
jgi:hypothetical protein